MSIYGLYMTVTGHTPSCHTSNFDGYWYIVDEVIGGFFEADTPFNPDEA